MIRNQFGKLRRGIERQSTIGRGLALLGAVVLFLIAQQFAAISNAAARGTPTMILAGLVGIVLAIVAIYAAYVAIRSFVGGRSGSQADA